MKNPRHVYYEQFHSIEFFVVEKMKYLSINRVIKTDNNINKKKTMKKTTLKCLIALYYLLNYDH